MINDDQILAELKKTNELLARSQPSLTKTFWYGFLHTMGVFFGYIIIFGVLAYIASRINWPTAMSNAFEKFMGNVNWEKIMPAPKINLDPRILQQ